MNDSTRENFGHDTTTDEVLAGVDLSGKLALVTGGSSGLGVETARALSSLVGVDAAFVEGSVLDLPFEEDAFDLLTQIQQIDFEIIFVTAYDHYALQAIRFCAIDYLLKPIKVPELLDAVQKVIDNLSLKWENQSLEFAWDINFYP